MNPPRNPAPEPGDATGAADTGQGAAHPGQARPGEARPGEARHDLRQRDIVEDALCLMQAVGTLSALKYLKSHAVEGQVIARVLLEPARRRGQQGLAVA